MTLRGVFVLADDRPDVPARLLTKRADEQYQLRLAEKEKQIQDAKKANDELKRKLEQGSQQAQREVLEL